MCEEELQGVLDESPNTPPPHPRTCRVAGQWASVGGGCRRVFIRPMTKKQRVAFERMLIRVFASVLPNKREVPTMEISTYRLTNEKIDA